MCDIAMDNYESDIDDPDSASKLNTPTKTKLKRGSEVSKTNRPKHRLQKFRNEWTKLKDFEDWIAPVPQDEYKAYCKFCKVPMVAEISVLKNHNNGKKHCQLLKGIKSSRQSLISSFVKPHLDTESNIKKKEKICSAEIKLAAFFAEHNISFITSDHLIDLLKKTFDDSETIQGLSMKRTKTTAIIKNVIGASQKLELANKLKVSKFSIMTDESTDIGTVKTSCVVVR